MLRLHIDSSNRTFMELKYGTIFAGASGASSSNRTFMELKFRWLFFPAAPMSGSNRTFMELKFEPSWQVMHLKKF